MKLVDAVKEHFPRLGIVARARGAAGPEALGVRPYEAADRADLFRTHNLCMLEAALPLWQDAEKRTSMANSAREQLERQWSRTARSSPRPPATAGTPTSNARTKSAPDARGWHLPAIFLGFSASARLTAGGPHD